MSNVLPKGFIADTPAPAVPAGAPKGFVPDAAPAAPTSYRFQIPDAKAPAPVVETQADKIARLQRQAAASKKESDYANSPLGFAANFGKDLISRVASSEVGLGDTVAKIISGPPNVEGFNTLSGQQTQLIKMIRDKESKGQDATKLRQIYNSNADLLDEHAKKIEEYNASLPSTGKAVGQLAGTALDVLSAGTYGKAAASMKTGELALGASKAALPTAAKIVTPVGEKTGLFSAKGAARVLQGGAIGYGYDVTQGLQGNRGEDRSGGKAFIPGMNTVIGAAIPAALELDKTAHNVAASVKDKFSQDAFVQKREQSFQNLIDNNVKTKNLDSKFASKGNNVAHTLASNDAYVPEVLDGKVNSDKAIAAIQQDVSPMAKIVRAVVESDNKGVSIDDLEAQSLKEIDDLKLRGDEYNRVKANILSDFETYRQNYGVGENKDIIPLSVVDDIKKAKYENINWNNPDLLSADRAIARAGRKTIERSITDIDVRALNQELGKLYDAQDMLTALNGRAVKGGRLGKYFARIIGGAIGSSHGPGGTIVGSMAADKLADFMQTSYFDDPVVKKAIGEIQSTQPELFAQAQALLEQRAADANARLALPPASPGPIINQGRPIPVFPAGTAPGNYLGKDTAVLPPMRVYGNEGDFGSLPAGVVNDKITNDILPTPPAPAPMRVFGNANDFQGLPPGVVNDKTANPLPMIGTIESAAAGTPKAIADTVARHIAESQQVLDNLDAATIEKEGGIHALIDHTKTNIVDGLRAEGAKAVADAIAKISTASFASLADFAAAVQKLLPK